MKKTKVNLIKYIAQNINPFERNEEAINKYCLTHELQIQVILFFVFGLFYQKFDRPIIKSFDFRAWKYGIVEINYHKWVKLRKPELIKNFQISLTNEECLYIETIVKALSQHSQWDLVDICHLSYAWYAKHDAVNNHVTEEDILRSFIAFKCD